VELEDEDDAVTEEPVIDVFSQDDSEYDYLSFEEFFEAESSDFVKSEAYSDALQGYEGILDDVNRIAQSDGVYHTRFGLVYIDEDDIPELVVSYGSMHICGIYVYRYDRYLDEVISYGEFGSSGQLLYYEKKGFIEYQDGNQGYFTSHLTMIPDDGSDAELKEAWIIDGSGRYGDGFVFYHDDSVYDDPSDLFAYVEGSEDNIISEEDLSALIEVWIGSDAEGREIRYQDMKSVGVRPH
jgi:hypothetical protein